MNNNNATKEITCIICPIGCKILVKTDKKNCKIVGGNRCKKGIDYAKNEATNPQRILTTSVAVENGGWPLVSVKTSQPVPKEKIFHILEEIKKMSVKAPIKNGDIIIKNILSTGADVVATKTVKKQLALKKP